MKERSPLSPREQDYILKLYDQPLLKFTILVKPNPLENVECISNISLISKNLDILPFSLIDDLSEESLENWLKKRNIPRNRTFVEKILSSAGMDGSLSGFLDITKGLSLNDSFWIVPKGFAGKFDDYNLYDNDFDRILSLVAYTGVYASRSFLSSSPELTTGGMLAKAWRRVDSELYLFKAGSFGFSNSGMEPYSEYYVSVLARHMGLSAVEYDLVYWKGKLASVCKLFTDIDTAYIPMGHIVKTGGIQPCVDFCDSLGKDFGQSIRDMLVFDTLVCQEDRHYGNFGLLRDNKTGKFTGFAPLFDNGVSLLNYGTNTEFKNSETVEQYAKTRTNPYGMSATEICTRYITGPMRKRLRKILEFSFPEHPRYNLKPNRLKLLNELVRNRTRLLLEIRLGEPNNDYEEHSKDLVI